MYFLQRDFHPYDYHVHLCNESWLSVRPAALPAWQKDFNVGHYTQTVQLKIFIPVMPIDTIDFYHFVPLSLPLTLPWGHRVSTPLPSPSPLLPQAACRHSTIYINDITNRILFSDHAPSRKSLLLISTWNFLMILMLVICAF